MRYVLLLLLTALLTVAAMEDAFAISPKEYNQVFQEGDLIFHKSKSRQSVAIQEATNSEWTHVGVLIQHAGQWLVYEAAGKVQMTSVEQFINRGENKMFVTKRLRADLMPDQKTFTTKLKQKLDEFKGKQYDIYFEWADDKIYCSELTYKVYSQAFGIDLGLLEQWKDMRLDKPAVRSLISQRIDGKTKTFKPAELIVTPVSQFHSDKLVTGYDSRLPKN